MAKDKTLTRKWDLFNTGVTVDKDVGQGAAIMAASVLLYGIVQVGEGQEQLQLSSCQIERRRGAMDHDIGQGVAMVQPVCCSARMTLPRH